MSDTRRPGKAQVFRMSMWLFAMFFGWMWWEAYKPMEHLASIPPESIVPQQYREASAAFRKIEEIFRVAAIVCITIAGEGTVIAASAIRDWFVSWRFDGLFKKTPRQRQRRHEMPALITADIDACVTPNLREAVSLRNFQKLQQYCSFARVNKEFPPMIFVSARAQEYTELLCQTLNIINPDNDVPCVLENGMALYYPAKRTVERLITDAQLAQMVKARDHLLSQLRNDYEFEPKDFMITINVERDRAKHQGADDPAKARRDAIFKLRTLVETALASGTGFAPTEFDVTNTDNAVDIVAVGVNKWTGLQAIMTKANGPGDKEKIVSIGNSEADVRVLKEVGQAFCSLDAMPAVHVTVLSRKKDNVIKEYDSAAVVEMLVRVTGLSFN